MPRIPRDDALDSTVTLVSDGYAFISKRCQRLKSDLFETRLLLQKTICMQGEEAARLFYDKDRFERRGAAPTRVQKTLLGQGGVQGLDGQAHRHRKQMFMSLMTPESIGRLADLADEQWEAYIQRWQGRDRVVLFRELQELHCRAVCAWAGVPLEEAEVEQRTDDLAAMIDSAGALGPRHWRGRWARRRAERWIAELVEKVRSGKPEVPEGSALHFVATHRNRAGEHLDERVAAVEILNLLRPTVAVARFIIFEALALNEHPQYRERIHQDPDFRELFVQEVRRYYPFFPFAAARVREAFQWNGYRFPEGVSTLLDLYGTNHDARIWEKPEQFRPERFQAWEGSPFDFIPQGGGDHHENHRCAGEWITIELMKRALIFLIEQISYDVPVQDLSISLSRIPAIPASRFVITNVQHVNV